MKPSRPAGSRVAQSVSAREQEHGDQRQRHTDSLAGRELLSKHDLRQQHSRRGCERDQRGGEAQRRALHGEQVEHVARDVRHRRTEHGRDRGSREHDGCAPDEHECPQAYRCARSASDERPTARARLDVAQQYEKTPDQRAGEHRKPERTQRGANAALVVAVPVRRVATHQPDRECAEHDARERQYSEALATNPTITGTVSAIIETSGAAVLTVPVASTW